VSGGGGEIRPGLVLRLGLSQLVCWGISYYLVGVLGERITADLGWSPAVTHGGFSLALIVMGVASPLVGRIIDRRGGRPVMVAGSWLSALGCLGLAAARGAGLYYAAWACLGLAMRMTLYDAAFAALARLGGAGAKRPISQVTLLGGLASTVFWPVGHALADAFGWRRTLVAYAGFALLTLPLHVAIPRGAPAPVPARPGPGAPVEPEPLAVTRGDRVLAGALYALIATLTTFLNSAMSAHMIGILAGLGVGASLAVWISTLRGIGQSSARLCEVLFGAALTPLQLGVVATLALPLCFIAGLYSGASQAAAVAFALVYGASNGLATIVRGTLPLVLFEPRSYGRIVGGLLLPSFLVSALAPLAYAFVIERFGAAASLRVSATLGAVVLAAALASLVQFGGRRAARRLALSRGGRG
jgi:MFS family permease